MATRTRTRQVSEILPTCPLYSYDSGPPPLWSAGSPVPSYTRLKKWEWFTDNTGVDGRFRPCIHKTVFYNFQGDLYTDFMTVNTSGHTVGGRNMGYLHMYQGQQELAGVANAACMAPLSIDWDGFATTAMKSMLPQIEAGNSLLNFLYELRDFKSLAKALRKLEAEAYESVSHAARVGMSVWWEAWGSKPWTTKPRKVTSAYLSWKFAWAPFVSDLKKLIDGLFSWREQVRQLRMRQKQPQQRHWGKSFSPSYGADTWSSASTWGYTGPGPNRSKRDKTHKTELYRMTASMRYRYMLPPELANAELQVHAFLDMLGINANPAIVWDSIPFTFIIDWFVNVGEFLEQFQVKNLRPITEITDFGVSVRGKRTFSYNVNMSISFDAFNNVRRLSCNAECNYYERRVVNPTIWSFYDSPGGLSGTQSALAGALISVNLPKARKSRRPRVSHRLWR